MKKIIWIAILAGICYLTFLLNTECHAQTKRADYERDSFFVYYVDSANHKNCVNTIFDTNGIKQICIFQVQDDYVSQCAISYTKSINLPYGQITFYKDSGDYDIFSLYAIKYALWRCAKDSKVKIK